MKNTLFVVFYKLTNIFISRTKLSNKSIHWLIFLNLESKRGISELWGVVVFIYHMDNYWHHGEPGGVAHVFCHDRKRVIILFFSIQGFS